VILRPGRADDADALGAVFLAARADARFLPPLAHPVETLVPFLRDRVLPRCRIRVAEDVGRAVGFLALHDGWVEHLYVIPEAHRRGVGRTLLDDAKAASPEGLTLWCFQRNIPALAFYAAQGFVEVERTGGAGNEEREPDVRLVWRPLHR
jgi:GNAT superfamily N-acetyltransferase